MIRFITQRLLSMLLVAVAVVYLGFLGMHMMDNWRGEEPGYHLREDAGLALNDSLAFYGNLLQGELGEVQLVSGPRSVLTILQETYLRSMGLLLLALASASVVGLIFGSLAALARRSGTQYMLLLATMIGVSAPSFLIAILLQQGGIKYTRTFGSRLVSMGGYGWDFQHLAMPLLVLGARPVAYLTRTSYLALTRIMEEDYIRTAFAKGLSLGRTVLTHALRNFAIPFLTGVGVSLRFSLSTLPLVEYIFAWPGIGLQILEAIQEQMPILVVSIALVLGLTIQAIGLALDVVYSIVDPRVRAET
ncbi:MAG TPA: ABC transporter permease [Candidatus Sulfomarinibacteraceae bacterium]|nr:ABC transporter permease [Candidatus Sulfomarinibacteraceae bacterium]